MYLFFSLKFCKFDKFFLQLLIFLEYLVFSLGYFIMCCAVLGNEIIIIFFFLQREFLWLHDSTNAAHRSWISFRKWCHQQLFIFLNIYMYLKRYLEDETVISHFIYSIPYTYSAKIMLHRIVNLCFDQHPLSVSLSSL